MSGASRGRNHLLATVLEELGWSPARLAREINQVMGHATVGSSTAWDWLNRGRTPRGGVATVAAHVLSEATRRELTVRRLWSGRAKASTVWVPSNAGLSDFGDPAGIVAVVNEWLRHGGDDQMQRRVFLAISGVGLTLPAWQYVDTPSSARLPVGRKGGQNLTPPMLTFVEETVHRLRRLEEREGGDPENLRFIQRHFLEVADLLNSSDLTEAQTRRLLSNWAQLGHIAGFAAYDGERHGLAQRYFRTGLHAARAAGDREMGAGILAAMSYQAADRGDLPEGITLANAAIEAAQDSPPVVRSFVSLKAAFALARIGHEYGFRQAVEEARTLFERPGAADDRPDWLYFYSPRNLDSQVGHGLIRLSLSTPREPGKVVTEADQLIADGLHAVEPRGAVFRAAWLARAHAKSGDMDRAVLTGRAGLERLDGVRSPRAITQLRALETDLARARGVGSSREVGQFRTELREAMAA